MGVIWVDLWIHPNLALDSRDLRGFADSRFFCANLARIYNDFSLRFVIDSRFY